MIIYNESTGKIFGQVKDGMDYKEVYKNYNLSKYKTMKSKFLNNIDDYYVKDGKIKKYTIEEKNEVFLYGKILDEEERKIKIRSELNKLFYRGD